MMGDMVEAPALSTDVKAEGSWSVPAAKLGHFEALTGSNLEVPCPQADAKPEDAASAMDEKMEYCGSATPAVLVERSVGDAEDSQSASAATVENISSPPDATTEESGSDTIAKVNGGYGVMVQVPEVVLQSFLDAFFAKEKSRFQMTLERDLELAKYGITSHASIIVALERPRLKLLADRSVELGVDVHVAVDDRTQLLPLPGGGTPPDPPELMIDLVGALAVTARAEKDTRAVQHHVKLSLVDPEVTSFEVAVNGTPTIDLGTAGLTVLSAIVRRAAVKILATQVVEVPLSFEIDPQIPVLTKSLLAIDFKLVSSGDNRAIAIVVECPKGDLAQVGYALDNHNDIGIFLDLDLLNRVLRELCRRLNGFTPPGAPPELMIVDADIRVRPGAFRLVNVKVQSRTLQAVTRTIERILCTAIDPCNLWCRKVFEKIIEWVQLDQLANANGDFAPYVQDGRIRVDGSHIDVNLAAWAYALIVFTAAAAFVPLGGVIAAIGLIIGKMFLDRTIERWVDNYAGFSTFIDKKVPGTSVKLQAFVRALGWPSGTLAVFATAAFSKAEDA